MSWKSTLRDEIRSIPPPRLAPSVAIRLDENGSTYALEESARAGLAQHLGRLSLGSSPDRQAAPLRAQWGQIAGLTPEQILVGNSTEELVRLLCATFGKQKPMESRVRVAFPIPGPAWYRTAVICQGARSLEMPLKEDFALDLLAMDRHITGGNPNILLFCRPNDPTGNLWDRDEMERVIAEHTDVIVAVDETYYDYAQDTLIDLLPRYPHLVILRSLSQLGLAGLQISFLVGHPDVISEVAKVQPASNVGMLDQHVASWVLEHCWSSIQESVRLLVEERNKLADALGQLEGVEVYPSASNFLLLRVADGPGTCRALLTRNIAVTNVSDGGALSNCLRISVRTAEENAALVQELPESIAQPEPAPPVSRHKEAEKVNEQESQRLTSGLPKFL